LWNLPNTISLSRLILAAAFLGVHEPIVRVVIVAIAAATDFLDGFAARMSDQRSVAGALIDPIADRIFALAAVSGCLADGLLTTGQFFIFISRDLATAIGFLVARIISWLRPVVFRARLLGKAVTVLQLATLIAALMLKSAVSGLIIAIGLLSAMSIVDYTLALWRARAK
jgi:phosphatidylglycerophosphate synthase